MRAQGETASLLGVTVAESPDHLGHSACHTLYGILANFCMDKLSISGMLRQSWAAIAVVCCACRNLCGMPAQTEDAKASINAQYCFMDKMVTAFALIFCSHQLRTRQQG